MDLTFNGKTAIVTGAASGIGAAIAEELAASGATVIVADLQKESAQAQVDKITAAGGKALPYAANVADPEAVAGLVDFATSETGALHMMVNNAGIGGAQAPVGEYPIDSWKQVIDVNLNGVFYGMRYAIPAIKAAGGGSIVNIASILGSVGIAGSAAYVTAKHGVVGLTKSAAIEHSKEGVRINSVGPGFIHTPLVDSNLDADTQEALSGAHPIGRMGTPEEVASLVVYLLSDRASFVTGSYHLVDGAYTAQ
ncbi:SDR family NAD(P)-dependent oxidoreductase [Pseudooceanicola sp. HF7]|uniref:SDR family NAD(P)-dependent oxidoreductase n=1 Tax=Pseudooceanicola sp. HF7 TaxID=2721560 RepID=UPI001431310A|nr:SDR family NAD(P)-dependent oxidoreductase [Pseudooceanicola sp. HF7]NIZ10128.1 SDR family oxidoreductase [Pseudooceanicola sp. HF7]